MSKLCGTVWLIVYATSVSGQLTYEPSSSEETVFTTTMSVTAPLRTSLVTPLRTTPLSDVAINLPQISQTPTSTSKFKVGDHVRIITDMERLRNLQKGHGGWFLSMLPTLGQKGLVEEIDDDGNLRVMVSGTFWTFNPMSVTKVAESRDLELSSTQRSTRQRTEVFRDDFNDQSINIKKWSANKNEHIKELYTGSEVRQECGYMILQCQGVRFKVDSNHPYYPVTTVTTSRKFSFLYGEVEWRAKLSGGHGTAIFLYIHSDFGYYTEREIAITARGDIKDMISPMITYYRPSHEIPYNPMPILSRLSIPSNKEADYRTKYGAVDTVENFHTFKIIWEPEQIIWLVDGRQIWNITDREKIPHEEAYLLMKQAVGEAWTGRPDNTTSFPTRMLIDYVTVHQWK